MTIIQRSYKFRYYPNQKQVEQLAKEFGCNRFVWNWALRLRSDLHKKYGQSLNNVSLSSELTLLKKTEEFSWLNDVVANGLTQTLINQDAAFKHFFRRVKEGKKKSEVGYPKFKNKRDKQSVRFQLDQRIIHNIYKPGFLRLPKLGEVKLAWSRMPQGIPKMATISLDCAGRYWVSMSVAEAIQQLPMKTKSVGVDVGIKDVAVTSDGYHSGAPKFTRKYERKLKRLQRKAARALRKNNPEAFKKGAPKKKGEKLKVKLVLSNRDKKLMARINKVHAKIADCRKDWTHKLTHKIVSENGYIAIEDLTIKGMLKNRKLSKSVADSGLYEVRRQLEYKSAWNGRQLSTIGRFERSTGVCPDTGVIGEKLGLHIRSWVCECCNKLWDRDEASAQVILNLSTRGKREANAHRLPNNLELCRQEAA